jgi:WD40 repeat protein
VQRIELASGKKAVLAAHDSWVRSIAFLPDGETTLTGGYDGRLAWRPTAAEKPEAARKIDAHAGWIRGVAVHGEGKVIATGGNDRLVKLWNAADGKLIRELAGHESHVYSVLFHPQGKSLLSGDLRGQVKQWEWESGKLVRTFDAKALHSPNEGQGAEYGGVRSMAVSSDGKQLACAGLHKASNPFGAVQEPLVLLFDWDSQKLLQSHVTEGDQKSIAWRVVFHPDGYLVGAMGGSAGGALLFCKADQPKEFQKFALPNTALDMDMASDSLQLATVHHDRHVRLSRMEAKKA